MKADGIIEVTTCDGHKSYKDTYQCPHCGVHWTPVKGSGRPHIFCTKCCKWTCSNPECLGECYPIEKRLDDIS